MRDKRSVGELSIEELERILAIRKREARQERLRRYSDRGRRVSSVAPVAMLVEPEPPAPQQHEAAEDVPPVEPPITYDLTGEMPRFEDELDDEFAARRRGTSNRQPVVAGFNGPFSSTGPGRGARDRLLLGVEILTVVGMAVVLLVGGYMLRDLTRETEAAEKKTEEIEQKTGDAQREAAAMLAALTPVPELRVSLSDYVLPGGHYSPVDTGGIGAFNLDELPASIRPRAMAQLSAPRAELVPLPKVSPKQLEIPAIEVYASVYAGDDWYALQKGVGHFPGSANPGDRANMVLTAHNDIYGEIFRYIEKLEDGDEVRVMADNGRWYTYVVFDKQIVAPTEVRVLEPGNQPIVTLITCHPYRVDNQRMVVFARLRE